MEGVASAFAVVSLAVQLVETGENISSFFASVQDAPSEVVRLAQTLEQLNSTLKQVSYLLDQQYLARRLPGSPVFITNALENCEKRMKTLENVIQKAKTAMDHRNRVHRSWAAMRFVSKKEDIREMQSQLRDAEAGLQTAMLSNSWQLQMHAISISSSAALQTTTIGQSSPVEPTNPVPQDESLQKQSSAHRGSFRTTSKRANLVLYRGFFGSVDVQSRSISLNTSKYPRTGHIAISEEKTIKITPSFLRKTLELRFLDSFGQISRTLRTYSILDDEAPIFKTCRYGDLEGLQVALSSGTASPFVLDEDGWSLLHHAAILGHVDMCALLLQLGVDPDLTSHSGIKAMILVALSKRSFIVEETQAIDTLRLLTQSQDDISPQDMVKFWMWFSGPVEVAKFMYSNESVPSESDVPSGEEVFPFLAIALNGFRADPSQWENLLRHLLRKRAGLHSRVPRMNGIAIKNVYPCELLGYGTPLDELLRQTETPFEAEEIADRWLQILLSEGFDVVAYLEEEYALHAQQMQLTVACDELLTISFTDSPPRQLIYQWGSTPSISWDWWIDPSSSTYLIREEFKYMSTVCKEFSTPPNDWATLWPLRYPAWSVHYQGYESIDESDRRLLYQLAQERANRRWEKKMLKAARAQGPKKQDRMPGAWPV